MDQQGGDLKEVKEILTGTLERPGLVHVVNKLTSWSEKVDGVLFGTAESTGVHADVRRHNSLEQKIESWGARITFWTITTLITALLSILIFLGRFVWGAVVGGGG